MISFWIYISLLIACLIACSINRQFVLDTYKFFQILFVLVLLFEICGFYITTDYENLLNHLYQPLEFVLMTLIYKHILSNSVIKKNSNILIIAFVLVSLLASTVIEGIFEPNTISFLLGSTVYILFGLIYVYELYAKPPQSSSLFKNPYFWINTGNLFFYCGTFFQMGLDAYLFSIDINLANELRIIVKILNYTLYSLYLIGFICRRIFR